MKLVSSLFLLILIGCQLKPAAEKLPDIPYPPELESVHQLIIEKKIFDARQMVENYLNNSANIHWHGHAHFLIGFLYEMEEKLPEAAKAYRSAVQHATAYDSAVAAKALYNLSFVLEKQEDYEKLLTVSLDLMKRRQYFDSLTAKVELPARMAAVYAFHNKMKEAEIFHREASANLKKLLRKKSFQPKPLDLSKSLFYLGFASFDTTNQNFKSLMRKISIGQKYFLASAEASDTLWADKSTARITELYNQAWGMVNSYQPKGFTEDRQAFRKQQQMRQLVMASNIYDLTFQLRAEEFPLGNVNRRSTSIMDESKQWSARIEKFAQGLDLGPEMIRNKSVPNTKLAIYIDKLEPLVEVNKEVVDEPEPINVKKRNSPTLPPKTKKQDIGKDPNL